jgi:hypothetical protein
VRGTGKRELAEWLGGFRNARSSSTPGRARKGVLVRGFGVEIDGLEY